MSLPTFQVGDLVRVYTKDPAENKIHATPFEGVVISVRGEKDNKTFTIRKLSTANVAVERIFPFNSPIIESIKVIKSSKVRRAKLYYLRNR